MNGVQTNGRTDGVLMNGTMTGILLEGMKVGNKRMTHLQAHFHLEVSIAYKGQQDFYLGRDGGYMIPIHSKIGQGMRTHFEKLVNWHGKNELIPVYFENNIFSFYQNREVQSTETNNVNDGKKDLIPVSLENNTFNIYLKCT